MPGASSAVGVGNVDLGQQGAGARLQRVGDARHLAGKAAIRASRARAPPRRCPGCRPNACVLRHEDLGADHVALHDGEHEGAGGRIGLHQAADVDVALGDDAVERRDDALIGLLLVQHVELRLLGDDVGLRDARPRLPGACSVCSSIGALLLRQPALLDQRLVAIPGDLRKLAVRLRLLQRRLAAGPAWPRPARSDGRARAPRCRPAAGPPSPDRRYRRRACRCSRWRARRCWPRRRPRWWPGS